MMPENTWRTVRPMTHPDGSRTNLLSAVIEGVRVYNEQTWSAPDEQGARTLLQERFYTTDPNRAHRTAAAAIAATTPPIEPNDP